MPIVSTGSLIDALRQHRLLSTDKLADLLNLSMGRCGDARALARMLVQRGWLTIYQINEILDGRAAQLAFGPYHLLDRLGQGGLSSVYKARHADMDFVVALKIIRPEALNHPEGRQQFLQEVEAMAALDHPNVVQFCDADQVGNTCYFAMEYIDGTDLGKLVRLGGPLPVREACDYIAQAALGLQHAHERNLVHRDIKPVNLFLTHELVLQKVGPYGETKPVPGQPLIKILDWGLASLCDPGRAMGQRAENVASGLIGTADYLSPEQARDAGSVDIRGDIYSLGCSFYFLLTGQPPFPEGSLMQKVLQHQKAEPKSIAAFRDDVPDGVVELVKRMLAKKPEDRFQTPAAVALALRPFVRGEDASTIVIRPSAGGSPSLRPGATPLPIPLGGKLGEALARMPKAGPDRGANPVDDTSLPHQR